MSLEENIPLGDKLITIDTVNFYVSSSAEEFVEGVTIDFGQNGFKLDGMKKSGNCCG
jgi:Fe-S cluster assembly iron-binding protein IscA